MEIIGKKIKLRAMELKDQEFLRGMVNDPEIEFKIGGYSFPVSSIEQKSWFENVVYDNKNFRLIIESLEGETIGFANITDIDWKYRSASHGIKIANPSFRGKGIGTDTVMAIMRYAFDELQLNRLETTIVEHNQASLKLYTGKCNWQIEGTKREAVFKRGKFHDLKFLSILKSEYETLINNSNY